MALVGLDGRWLRVNRALCSLVGYSEQELLAKTFQDITHPDDLDADLGHARDLIAGKVDNYHMEKRYVHRAGHVVWIHLTVSLLHDSDGRPLHFVSQIQDITERKQLEVNLARARDEALEASRLKSEFLATISHEIRTPMNAVIGMAELLAQTPLTTEQAEMTQTIAGGAENLLAIINDILDFSRIEAGRLRLDAVEFDFRRTVEETVALLSQRAQEKGLRMHCVLDSVPVGAVIGDSGRVRQVLTNLIGNAIKFTDAGEVEVRGSVVRETATRTRVRVSVRDTGIGIPVTAQRFLFQPFTQADGSPTRRFGGTGLGLAICRQLVEDLMGGQIGFESEAGKGSLFWFELEFNRRVSTVAASAPSAASARPPAGPTGKRLLLAEDNPANQRVAELLLQRMGYEVEVAINGEEALAQLAKRPFSAVLMDCQMPVLDGYEATRRIRSGRLAGVDANIPVIALTAYVRAEDRARCREAGMNDHVAKPIRPAELRAALEQCGLAPAAEVKVAPARVADDGVIDEEAFASARALPGNEGPSLLPELVRLYLSDEAERLARLARLVSVRQVEVLADEAHNFGGNAASFGGVEVRHVALELEASVRAENWPAAERELERLRTACARLRAELARRADALR